VSQTLKTVFKWAWLASIGLFVAYYLTTRFDLVKQTLLLLPFYLLAVALALIVVSKLCLSLNMRIAAAGAGVPLSFKESYRIYNLTQLAKYIPGSIWHFVGRIAIFKERGASAGAIRDALLSEHAWVIGSALVLAIVLVGFASPDFFGLWLQDIGADRYLGVLTAGLIVISVLAAVLLLVVRSLGRWLWRLRPTALAVAALVVTWACLGSAFWVTLLPFSTEGLSWGYAAGIYCFAYVVGFLVPFAPAGFGVREGVLGFALVPFMGLETALLLAGVNRILYILAELLVVLPAFMVGKP
jgi:hypothetical protein